MNEIIYSQIGYSADQWYKIDVLMDWESSLAAFFIDNVLKAETDFFSAERDKAKEADKDVDLSMQQSVAVIGLALIAMGEDIGSEMLFR